jgi:hypothetical protein
MTTLAAILLAQAGNAAQSPLTGSRLAALGVTLALVAALMLAIRFLGLYLAKTHPGKVEEVIVRPVAPPTAPGAIEPQVVAVIAAATATALEEPHRIVQILPAHPPSVESLMQHWSLEGRRAIYSSHRVR